MSDTMRSSPKREEAQIARFWKAIGDPVRLEIVTLLGKQEFLNVGDIAAHFHISRPAISHHLKVLRDAGVVQNEKVGQEVNYRLDAETMVEKLRLLADIIEECAVRQKSG